MNISWKVRIEFLLMGLIMLLQKYMPAQSFVNLFVYAFAVMYAWGCLQCLIRLEGQ